MLKTKKFIAQSRDGKRKTIQYKSFKSKVEGWKMQFSKVAMWNMPPNSPKRLRRYRSMLKKYDSDVAKMMKDVERPKLKLPVCPVPWTVMNPDGTVTQEKIDEMDVYVWKKD